MESKYIAHIAWDGREQSIFDHLYGTAKLAREFAEPYHAGEQAYLAGIAHDIGKYSEEFQMRIRGSKEKVNHSLAGAYECMNQEQLWAAFAVAGHHSGLPDLGTSASGESGTLMGKYMRVKNRKIPDYHVWKQELSSLPTASLPAYCGEDPLTDTFFAECYTLHL